MKVCILVDAYRLSKAYTRYLKNNYINCIHVQSSIKPLYELAKSSTYDDNDYLASYCYDGDFVALVNKLKTYSPSAVIAGTESGVSLADQLIFAFGLKGNDAAKSIARRNKYEMAKALNAAGVPCMKYANVQNVSEALEWIDWATDYPVVLKPLASAGTESVFICHSKESVIEKFHEIYGKKNCLGLYNQSVLVQEFLRGTEYMVNSVSCHGEHFFTDIWRCHKRLIPGYGMIYDREELLPPDGEVQSYLQHYLKKVLDALGFVTGAAHAEVIDTLSGPRLVEVGARVGGNVQCDVHSHCLGSNQLELNVDAYLHEEDFLQKTQHPWQLARHALTVLLSTRKQGVVHSIPMIKVIQSCKSVYWYALSIKPGDLLLPTRDLFTAPGKVILVSDDKDEIELDYRQMMQAMDTGFIVT